MTEPSTSQTTSPTSASVLGALTQPRILDLARLFGVRLRAGAASQKRQLAALLGAQLEGRVALVLRELGREELQAVCRTHGIADSGASRRDLTERLLLAAGVDPKRSVPPPPEHHRDGLPSAGQVVRLRHRQWLVEGVRLGEADESALVKLVCLDDDDSGRALDVLWDLELGAEVIDANASTGLRANRIDTPEELGAYLHALRWNAVSAADATRFQAPFRAGIKHMAHQLTPLMKALELPRANLFIADDVGLGKTIEAGLVMQELILRQQAELVLIACPASICLQWRDEMRRRFGLHFEVMTRQLVAQRRQQRGFGVPVWETHNRFIISHALLRRPEHREPLLRHLGPRARKSLLVLDEAHVAAPASRSRYAVDSEVTRTIRELAPRFDNRLFLSATPHNGHSNSFSALLEILDRNRFPRGVPVRGKEDLAPIMVRRLKRDLRNLGVESFPERILERHELTHEGGHWHSRCARSDGKAGERVDLGTSAPDDLDLASELARYTELCAPKKGVGRLPFIRLQQRLLSSPEAFARSLEVHAQSLDKRGGPVAQTHQFPIPEFAPRSIDARHLSPHRGERQGEGPVRKFAERSPLTPTLSPFGEREPGPEFGRASEDIGDPETHGPTDEAIQAEDDAEIAAQSASLPTPTEEARALLASMRARADRARRLPDAKVRALLHWLREHCCPAIGDAGSRASRKWTDRRVLVFTEWADTKRYLLELLTEAAAHTDRAEERLAAFQGGMGDESREDVQQRFNAKPAEEPLRILVATDAAREGINLQAFCADVFHVDLPWNPARLEQRNGRIDRTLQPSPEVRCHYFHYPARAEDRVLETLVRKVDIVQRELGSLGAVLLEDIEAALDDGIRDGTADRIERIGPGVDTRTVESELEASRKDTQLLRAEIDRATRRYESSQKALEVSPDALRGVFDVGLRLAGTTGLVDCGVIDDRPAFRMPELDRSWALTLDSIRRPRRRDESVWDWRREPPRPVTFTPLAHLSSDVEQLHLAHPVVRRVLDRFLAQGFSAHDLSRVSAIVSPDSVIRVLVFARLSLFGPGAARLHDEIVATAAPWNGDAAVAAKVEAYRDAATIAKAVELTERLLAGGVKAPGERVKANVAESAEALFGALWQPLHDEADARAAQAKGGLATRARKEADDLRILLERRRRDLRASMVELRQGELLADKSDAAAVREQRRQVELDLAEMGRRETELETDIDAEPEAVAALYDVRMTRVSPVALVVAWPESMT
ncbi:MAG: DEAD/DEAH box helicase [Deltaproteobacteria bacterium]|nr:DEAD/DEAH box helicase [Deltaproteobacteria bacterium]